MWLLIVWVWSQMGSLATSVVEGFLMIWDFVCSLISWLSSIVFSQALTLEGGHRWARRDSNGCPATRYFGALVAYKLYQWMYPLPSHAG